MKKLTSILILLIALSLSACGSEKEGEGEEIANDNENIKEDRVLDMQGYFLEVPKAYNCSGGFVDGYRYQEARCLNNDRSDYKIIVDHGLAASGINPEKGLVDNQLVTRSFEFTGGVYGQIICQEHYPENLKLDAEHYLCFHNLDGNRAITMGIGKSFGNYGRWFEADLIIEEETNYTENDYIEILEKFLNQSIVIDWDKYRS